MDRPTPSRLGEVSLSRSYRDKKRRKTADNIKRTIYRITNQPFDLPSKARPKSQLLRLQGFLEQMESVALDANPGTDYPYWRYNNQAQGGRRGGEDGWEPLQEKLGKMSEDIDITIVDIRQKMREYAFDKLCTKPIFVPQDSPYGRSLAEFVQEGPLGIPEFLEYLNDKDQISVQDFERKQGFSTREVSVQEVKRHFLQPRSDDPVWNCLDIGASQISVDYTPREIAQEDLLRQADPIKGSATRGHRMDTIKDMQQWFLLTQAGSISDIHVDSGGLCTWIRVLVGRKIWYYGRGITNLSEVDKLRFVKQATDNPRGYIHGWSRIDLHAGDTW